MVNIDDKDLYQLLIAEFRYAVRRDNHLAPSSCAEHVQEYLPDMSRQWRAHTAKQLSEEIIDERLWNSRFFEPDFTFKNSANNGAISSNKDQLEEDYVWEALLVFLASYLEHLPHNVERYMEHIRGHMTYSEGIDYYSTEIRDKIAENINKK